MRVRTRLVSEDTVCTVNCSELNTLENYYNQYFHQHNTIIKKQTQKLKKKNSISADLLPNTYLQFRTVNLIIAHLSGTFHQLPFRLCQYFHLLNIQWRINIHCIYKFYYTIFRDIHLLCTSFHRTILQTKVFKFLIFIITAILLFNCEF